MNHAVLYVRDLARTVAFYREVLDFRVRFEMPGQAAFLQAAGSLVGASDHVTTKALYAHDPDGLEFEVCWLVPADRLPVEVDQITKPLDLAAEKARYGGSTRGGVGVSFPAPV